LPHLNNRKEKLMNGIFFVQLQQYINNEYESNSWEVILQRAEIPEGKLYFSSQKYDEEEFFRIFNESIRFLGLSRKKFLNGLGVFISLNLIKICKSVIKADWKTLDLLEHIEEFNTRLLQTGDDPALSGKFDCERISPREIRIEYTSPRKLCPLFTGLIKGIADYYKEKVIIDEPSCSLLGHPHCQFLISLTK
jgi:Haem-NO-binding